jgi:hypothetical protein
MSLDYDPLSTSSPFATSVSNSTPAWSTAQHSPESPQSNAIRRPVTPTSPLPPHAQSPHSPPATGPFGKEPQIYGQPSPGLISPGVGSNGTKYERNEPYLRVRITGLDRNRKDILLRLDAQVSLPLSFPEMRLYEYDGRFLSSSDQFTEFQWFHIPECDAVLCRLSAIRGADRV